jgi:hypothetical protein
MISKEEREELEKIMERFVELNQLSREWRIRLLETNPFPIGELRQKQEPVRTTQKKGKSVGQEIEGIIVAIVCIAIWVFGLIYSPWVRMLVVGGGLIGLGFLLAEIFKESSSKPKVIAYLALAMWGVGGLLVGIVIIQWASWYIGFRVGY